MPRPTAAETLDNFIAELYVATAKPINSILPPTSTML